MTFLSKPQRNMIEALEFWIARLPRNIWSTVSSSGNKLRRPVWGSTSMSPARIGRRRPSYGPSGQFFSQLWCRLRGGGRTWRWLVVCFKFDASNDGARRGGCERARSGVNRACTVGGWASHVCPFRWMALAACRLRHFIVHLCRFGNRQIGETYRGGRGLLFEWCWNRKRGLKCRLQRFLNFFSRSPFGASHWYLRLAQHQNQTQTTIYLPLSCFSRICRCHTRTPLPNLSHPPV